MTTQSQKSASENTHPFDDWNPKNTLHFETDLSADEMYKAEKARQDHEENMGINRRIALATLTQSYDQLKDGFLGDEKDTGETLVEMVESLRWAEKTAQADLDIYKSAIARIMLVVGDELYRLEKIDKATN